MRGAATLRAAADVLTLAGEGVAALVLVATDALGPHERVPGPARRGTGGLRLVTPASAEVARRA